MGSLHRAAILALLSTLIATQGCASKPYLHWHGGDLFGTTEAGGTAPSRVDCPGTTEQRFACFAGRVRERVASQSGALAVATADGALLHVTTTEPGQSVATSPDTVFPLASVSKMFTAATAVSLARAGLLELERPLASYLREVGANTELGRVTLHQLLTHTAGLVDDPRRPLCSGGGALPQAVARAHIGAAPGAVHLYSNIGYSLVGIVIERVTSKTFEEVVRERVLLPMKMTRATFDFGSLEVRGHPTGAGEGSRCRLTAPAGGLHTSSRELALWARAMSEPATHPLGPSLVETLTTPYVETGARTGEAYGYGVLMSTRAGVRVYHHGGSVEDFSAFVAWVPARKLGAAAMVNTSQGFPAGAVLRGLSLLLDLPDDWRANAEGSPRPLSAYVGTYVDRKSWLGRVRVRLERDELAFDYPDGPPPLLPPWFTFRFVAGEPRARFVVTAAGVAERVSDP